MPNVSCPLDGQNREAVTNNCCRKGGLQLAAVAFKPTNSLVFELVLGPLRLLF